MPKRHAGQRGKGIDYLLFLGTPDNVHMVKASSCHLLLLSSEHLLYIYIILPYCVTISFIYKLKTVILHGSPPPGDKYSRHNV